ncbi:MAG: hypothetical protein ACYDDZ_10935 [Acidimicrobiales bacterium]
MGNPLVTVQGIQVPSSSIDPKGFYKATSRERFLEKSVSAIQGPGQTDSFTIKQAGIIAALDLKVSLSVVVTPSTGSVGSTMRWPYDCIRALRLSANGVNNVINCSGAKLIAHRFMETGDLSDKGVAEGISGASPGSTVYSGSLALSSEEWGIGQNVSAIAAGTYNAELYFRLPVAFDLRNLLGAIFAQTAATSIDIGIDWAPVSELFTIVAPATVAITGSCITEGIVFTIPRNPAGDPIIPNLSAFHSLVQNNDFAVGTGAYESMLMGTGVGKRLLRAYWQLWSGSPAAPLAVTSANFGQCGWRLGGNVTPEAWNDGTLLRNWEERLYNTDVGFQGFGCMDFASQWAMRDSIDEATATNLRLLVTPVPALTNPVLEVTQETLYAGAGAA